MGKKRDLGFCSFCGKGHEEVEKLIAGPGVGICDSCVRVCQGVLREEGVTPPRSDAGEILSKIRLLVELHGDGMLNDQDHIAKVAELVGEERTRRTGENESP